MVIWFEWRLYLYLGSRKSQGLILGPELVRTGSIPSIGIELNGVWVMLRLDCELRGCNPPVLHGTNYTKSWYKCCAGQYTEKSIRFKYINGLFVVL